VKNQLSYCAYFICPHKRGRMCCAQCEEEACPDRCLNQPKACGLCSEYPRPELRLPADVEDCDVG